MTGELYTAYAGCAGPANFGIPPERVKLYNKQARERIAEENAAKEKAEEALQQLGSVDQKKERVRMWWYKLNHRTWGGGF